MPDGSPYETGAFLSQYLMFHYGDVMAASPRISPPPDSMDFHARCAALAIEFTAPELRRRAIDIGCAVGRATFELCRACGEVTGIDSSKKFIAACGALKRDGSMSYRYPVEGEIMAEATARVPPDIAREKAHFGVGDACALGGGLGVFGIVLMVNLLDRLAEPRSCLAGVPALIEPGGTLVVATPCTWLPEFTPKENWLGGRIVGGVAIRTREALESALSRDFRLVAARDMPFLIPEHARKFQWSIALTTVWRKRPAHEQKEIRR